jgi:hypothetical protein
MDEGIGHFSPGFVKIFPDSSPGNAHDRTGLFLAEAVYIYELQKLKLFRQEGNDLAFLGDITPWGIAAERAFNLHPSPDSWPSPATAASRFAPLLHGLPEFL